MNARCITLFVALLTVGQAVGGNQARRQNPRRKRLTSSARTRCPTKAYHGASSKVPSCSAARVRQHGPQVLGPRPRPVRRPRARLRPGVPGRARAINPKGVLRVPTVMDNLIHRKEMPATIGIFITPGQRGDAYPDRIGTGNPNNRSVEYDSLGDAYARFLVEELLPEVGKTYNLTESIPRGERSAGPAAAPSARSPSPGSGPTSSARSSV